MDLYIYMFALRKSVKERFSEGSEVVGVSVSFRTISLPFEAIRGEYLSRTQWLRKGRPSCPFCTQYELAPWSKTYDRYIYTVQVAKYKGEATPIN